MKKNTKFVAISNQKGGVGKSVLTTIVASYMHYIKEVDVMVIDADYPQYSITGLREREKERLKNSEDYRELFHKQVEATQKRAYPVIKALPEKAISVAMDYLENSGEEYDIVFFDLAGSVNSKGILEVMMNLDYIFCPIATDRMVMQSSLSFATSILALLGKEVKQTTEIPLKDLYLFWNKVDARENKDVYNAYTKILDELKIKVMKVELPDTIRFKKEVSFERKEIFRSTLFPPKADLLRGSRVEELVEEILSIINI